MTRKLLLLGVMLGVAAVAGTNEARAVAVLDTARPVAQATPNPLFAPVGFKRQGLHGGSGGIHKSFRDPRFLAGKRLGDGGVVVRKGFVGPRFFAGKRLGDGGVIVEKRSVDPRLFLGKRFGHRPFFSGRHLHRFHR